jgi:E3 ubiquitin-protein ligase CCNP1IP1
LIDTGEKDVHIGLEQRQCAVCATKMEERTIRVSEVQPDLGELQRKLTGLNPNDMLTAVAYGLKFWDDQLELRYRTELEKSFTSAQRSAEMYKRKLQVCRRLLKRHMPCKLT